MFWYWIVFISLFFFAFLEQFGNIGKQRAKKICFVYTLLFIFLGTIRWDMTLGDWEGYYWVFQWEDVTSLEQAFTISYWPFEPLFFLMMRIINYLTGSYTVLLCFMATVTCGCFYKAAVYLNERTANNLYCLKEERSTIIAAYLAFWATGCAGIFTVRTNMATAICLIAIKYVEERKLWKFITMVLVASMFHFAAIIFFIVYPLYYKKIDAKWIAGMFCAAVIISMVGIQRIIPLIGLLGGRYAEKIASYNLDKSGIDFSYQSYSTLFLTIRAMANTILIILICIYTKRYLRKNQRYNGLLNIYITGAFIQALTIGFNLEFARVAVFFLSIQYFVLPYIFKLKLSGNKLFYFWGYTVFMVVKMYSLLGSSPDYANFTTIFNK